MSKNAKVTLRLLGFLSLALVFNMAFWTVGDLPEYVMWILTGVQVFFLLLGFWLLFRRY